jgi:hypothetical protein
VFSFCCSALNSSWDLNWQINNDLVWIFIGAFEYLMRSMLLFVMFALFHITLNFHEIQTFYKNEKKNYRHMSREISRNDLIKKEEEENLQFKNFSIYIWDTFIFFFALEEREIRLEDGRTDVSFMFFKSIYNKYR